MDRIFLETVMRQDGRDRIVINVLSLSSFQYNELYSCINTFGWSCHNK